MKKNDFESFKVGTVFNQVSLVSTPELCARSIKILYPSRLEAMALDPAKIAENDNLIYDAGQIDFCVSLYKHVTLTVTPDDRSLKITDRSPRKALIRHAALIMQHALNISDGLLIDVEDAVNLRHCGLGSSSSLIAATAAAVNELYGRPIARQDLVRFCAQNHGEEIDGDDNSLVPVQCIGGSAVCGHYDGGLVILSGQATPIYTYRLPEALKVVIGIPKDFAHPDAEKLMQDEIANMDGFKQTGNAYGHEIAYRLVHEVLPGLANDDLEPCKSLIFDYRWDMGSIRNCSFVYPAMVEMAERMRFLKNEPSVAVLSLSSVGPGFFALTSKPQRTAQYFEQLGMSVHHTTIHNGTYVIAAKR